MLPELDDYDWREAFGSAGEPDAYNRDVPTCVPGATVSPDPFTREDVKRIIAMSDGENDESEWIGVFELHDGRFASVVAGCDYTGWD